MISVGQGFGWNLTRWFWPRVSHTFAVRGYLELDQQVLRQSEAVQAHCYSHSPQASLISPHLVFLTALCPLRHAKVADKGFQNTDSVE